MVLRRFLTVVLFAWFTFTLRAQSSFQMFFEKAYVATDRTYYAAGEDIWMEAYLVNAQTNIRINTSANLYIELVNPDGIIVSQETLHLVNGLAKGDFILPAGVASGRYRIRAYTNWMKNFGSLFLFEKQLTVVADDAVKTVTPKYQPTIATVVTNKATVGVNHIYFFPEGGAMVAGLPAQVAVKTVDANGKGISAKGRIVNANRDFVAAFETSPSGFGSFTFTPLAGVPYSATGKYYGRELFTEPLPLPLSEGLVLGVKETATAFEATVKVSAAYKQGGLPVYLIVRHAGKKCFSDSISPGNVAGKLPIPKDSLPYGLCAITLYDADMKPQCERLVYAESGQPLRLRITPDKPAYAPQDSATVNVTVTDAGGKPVMANLSLAVTNAGLIEKSRSNMASYLLLESEIRGEIENPLQYFDPANANRKAQLDLLLQTQGWRSFLWRRLKDTSVVVKYLPEPGITISGRVRRALINQGIGNANITLYAEKSAGDKLFFTKTQPDGRFFLDGLPLNGLQNVKLVVRNDKNKKEGMILLDSVLGKPLPLQMEPNLVYDTSATTDRFWKSLASRNTLMKEQERWGSGELETVIVRADSIKKQRIQEGGLRYGHADSLFTIQPADAEYETLARFIAQRYPGAYTDAESPGFFFYGDRMTKILPRWIVDGKEDRFSTGSPFEASTDATDTDPSGVQPVSSRFERIDYYNIPINKVKQVYIEPQVSRSGAPIYIVHLSLLPGAFDANDLSQIITQVNGYYEARQYYVPDFSNSANFSRNDLRSTLFWAPDIKTDAAGKATVRYRNGGSKTTVRISVEGIANNGQPVGTTMEYKVN